MLLAAGRGERMRPLTDQLPKPLLPAGGKPLIVWHIEALVRAGIRDLVVNHAYLGTMIETALGDGARWSATIRYSPEPAGALETAGGIAAALPLLGPAPFLVINADIHCDWPVDRAPALAGTLGDHTDAHLVLVDNPPQHPRGDFVLADDGACDGGDTSGQPRLTFAGIGVYHPRMFSAVTAGTPARLAPLLRQSMAAGRVRAEHYRGRWTDVGTPERLASLNAELAASRGR